MTASLTLIPTDLLSAYLKRVPQGIQEGFAALQDAELSTDTFNFYTSVSSVFSSKIEGEDIELDSYIKHKRFGIEFLPDYTKKIDDLYEAHTFARSHQLNREHITESHRILSRHLVAKHRQGKFRTQNMYVSTPDGRIDYVAASPFEVKSEMEKLFHDISILLKLALTIEETFFYASMIHLVFVKIHPWNDGNGRSARLIEKWFLSEKLDEKAWYIQSEKYYYQQHSAYYNNIRLLGLEYPTLDYQQALPFLGMLPRSVAGG